MLLLILSPEKPNHQPVNSGAGGSAKRQKKAAKLGILTRIVKMFAAGRRRVAGGISPE
ncbi:MAG: hypothetical protein L7W94_04550 [Alphaproteobacteria bacterium]|nr:hypothetical protein [Alphaproteobacteria bacterium]